MPEPSGNSSGRPARHTSVSLARLLSVVAGAITAMLALALASPGAGAQPAPLPGLEPIPAPATSLSADGTSATDGTRTLTVSTAHDIDPSGQTIVVSGEGYVEFKGIYIAFCLVPPLNQKPSPCGGGIDLDGGTGASQWISSNPPDYGVGLAIPYGPGGSFSVELNVGPLIGDTVDCRRVSCAVTTRNDHMRSMDRSQDIFVPVTFASGSPAPQDPSTGPEEPVSSDVPPGGAAEPGDTTPPPVDTTVELPPSTTTTAPTVEQASGPPEGGSGNALPWILGGVAGAVAIAGAATWFVLSRRGSSAV